MIYYILIILIFNDLNTFLNTSDFDDIIQVLFLLMHTKSLEG